MDVDPSRGKIGIRGVYFDDVNMDEALARAAVLVEGGHSRPARVHTPNAEIVQLCVEQPEYYALINAAELVIADGAGVVLASKILGRRLKKGKVAGVEFGEKLAALAAKRGWPLFILGGKPGVAEIAAEKLCGKYPGLEIAGTNDGFFKDDGEVVRKINASGAKILYVCTGAPRQEKWMDANLPGLEVALMCGLGGSVDIYAGTVKRAPKIFIKLGLEWFHRLLREPKRIGRMMKLPKFIIGTVFNGRKPETDN